MTPSLIALALYGLWTIFLTLHIAALRTVITTKGQKAANAFAPGAEDLGGYSQRLARAHANCYENLPVFGAIIGAAILSGQGAISDQWAMWILYARVAQSLVHLATTSVPGVMIRFALYLVQAVLLIIITLQLLGVF